MRTFVMGDIHGAWKALVQCLDRAGFDRETDELIQLGDVADGHDDVYRCVEELLDIKNLIAIKGNHDDWFAEYIQTGIHPDQWLQGGAATARSYLRENGKEDAITHNHDGYITGLSPADIPEHHQTFFKRQYLYYIDTLNNCFVHAGFDRRQLFKGQSPDIYLWDRRLWKSALSFNATQRSVVNAVFRMETPFKEVFIGHTSTTNWNTDKPMHAANVWNLDTGAGHDGRLTIMDITTKEFWQSDKVADLYPLRSKN